MDSLIEIAQTPEGLIILGIAAFVLATFIITSLIFLIGSLLRRGKPAEGREAGEDAQDDPLESFDRASARAPIALARLRAQGPDITRVAEPRIGPASEAAATSATSSASSASVPQDPQPLLSPSIESTMASVVAPPVGTAAPVGERRDASAEDSVELAEPVRIASSAPSTSSAPSERADAPEAVREPPARPVEVIRPVQVVQDLSPAHQPRPAFQAPPSRPAAPAAPARPDPFSQAAFLLTLPFERRQGLSVAHADICGAAVEAIFFDPESVSRWDEDSTRLVPFLPARFARLLVTEADRETFSAGELFAQPDAVIELDQGLIALEYKSRGGRMDDPLRWVEALRTKDLLQTALGALALSAESGRPAAPVLRTQNAVYYIRPTPAFRAFLVENISRSAAFLAESSGGAAPRGVAASDCAELLAPALERRFPRPESAASARGRLAHDAMLARRA